MFVVVLAAAAAAAPTVDALGATSRFLLVFVVATGPAMVVIARCAGSDFILQV